MKALPRSPLTGCRRAFLFLTVRDIRRLQRERAGPAGRHEASAGLARRSAHPLAGLPRPASSPLGPGRTEQPWRLRNLCREGSLTPELKPGALVVRDSPSSRQGAKLRQIIEAAPVCFTCRPTAPTSIRLKTDQSTPAQGRGAIRRWHLERDRPRRRLLHAH